MSYPMPSNLTGISGIFGYANQVTNNWFCILIPFAVLVIILIVMMQRYKVSDSIALAGTIAFIFSAFLWGAGLLETSILTIYLLIMIAGGLYAFLSK